MQELSKDILEAQRLMRAGYWDAADDLLDQVLAKAKHMDQKIQMLKAENKQHKLTIRNMDRRIMNGNN